MYKTSNDVLYDNNVIENVVLNIGDYDDIYADVGFYEQDLVKKTRTILLIIL
ncbi:hypothetical protein PPBDW_I20493 [Photobacterium kishitanii]|nr:hypothetical protein PPBDW_I20493 [Photobacterium kishitanii]